MAEENKQKISVEQDDADNFVEKIVNIFFCNDLTSINKFI